jgi:hypothetical protein
MKRINLCLAIFLTLLPSGCTFFETRFGKEFQESCQSHAYTQIPILEFISKRYTPNAPVRIGVVPGTAPANMSSLYIEQPSAGNQLAWRIQQDLLNYGQLPIVEVLNRQEWPGKKDEFFTGNFGAIRYAREAGYDIVIVSWIEPMRSPDTMTAFAKAIDVESGTTIYYGKSTAISNRQEYKNSVANLGILRRTPAEFPTSYVMDKLGQCVSQAIMKDTYTPKD